ncbi:MAG TPA: hypothetical protein VF794_04100, partial [Archangium sp.]|uniref:hypothetical protein n=1 Tax=Archangium sp. TaxID=1872627 RepID=UPI002EDA9A6C
RLQEKFLRGGSLSKRVPLRELDKIGQKLQAVRTDENLKEAVRALDSWEQRHLPRSEAPLPTAEPTPGAANAERSPTELNQERYAHQEEADSIDATEQLMQKLLRLQEKFLRGESPSKRVPLRELDKIGQKIRAALTDKDLKEAARALDSWQLRHLP